MQEDIFEGLLESHQIDTGEILKSIRMEYQGYRVYADVFIDSSDLLCVWEATDPQGIDLDDPVFKEHQQTKILKLLQWW